MSSVQVFNGVAFVDLAGPSGGSGGGGVTSKWVSTAANSGLSDPSALTVWPGDYYAHVDNAVINNLDILGTLYACANNITFNNTRAYSLAINMAPGGNYGVPVRDGMRFNHSRFRNVYSVGCKNAELNYCHVQDIAAGTLLQVGAVNDGVRLLAADGLKLYRSFFKGVVTDDPAHSGGHYEAIHTIGVTRFQMLESTFDFNSTDAHTLSQMTSVLNLDSYGSQATDHNVIDGCLIRGGGLYNMAGLGDYATVTNTDFAAGPRSFYQPINMPIAWSNNTFDGAPFPMPWL